MVKLTIYGELLDLNAYLAEVNRHAQIGNKRKREETEHVRIEALASGARPVSSYPVHITFDWYSPNARKDIDNVAFAKKYILDGLQEAGIIEDDSRKYIAGFTDRFFTDAENPRVEVVITPHS